MLLTLTDDTIQNLHGLTRNSFKQYFEVGRVSITEKKKIINIKVLIVKAD